MSSLGPRKLYWRGTRVSVFEIHADAERQVGEYERNYSTLFNTFCAFRRGDRWLALYSPDYTASRIMELPSCRDLGGEERSGGGFCPVDYYVPTTADHNWKATSVSSPVATGVTIPLGRSRFSIFLRPKTVGCLVTTA